MSRFLRPSIPPPDGGLNPAAARLADLNARVVQAVDLIDNLLRWHGHNSGARDALLDVRNLLRPPERPTP